MNRKIISLIVILAMVFAFSSCGGKTEGTQSSAASQTTQKEKETESESAAASVKEQAESSKASTAAAAEESPYDYTPGVLNTVVDKNGNPVVTEFHIEGLQILSDADGEVWDYYLENPDFRTEGIKSELDVSAYTGMIADLGDKDWSQGSSYFDTINEKLLIIVAPHRPLEEYAEMDADEREAYWTKAEEDEKGQYCYFAGDDSPKLADFILYYSDENTMSGTKDILFVWDGEIAQFVVVEYLTEAEYDAGGYNNGSEIERAESEAEAAEEAGEETEAEFDGEVPEGLFAAFEGAVGDDGDSWPDADMWASIGLPALDYSGSGENPLLMIMEDSISVKGWAENETLAETVESLANMLSDEGFDVETRNTLSGDVNYVAAYEHDGVPLEVTISGANAEVSVYVEVQD